MEESESKLTIHKTFNDNDEENCWGDESNISEMNKIPHGKSFYLQGMIVCLQTLQSLSRSTHSKCLLKSLVILALLGRQVWTLDEDPKLQIRIWVAC